MLPSIDGAAEVPATGYGAVNRHVDIAVQAAHHLHPVVNRLGQRSYLIPAGVDIAQRVVEAVGIAVVALRVGGGLQHGVRAQEVLQTGSINAAVHVDEGGLAASAIVLCVSCLRYTMAVCIGAPSTRARCAHTPALKGGKQLQWAICGTGGHGAKVGKLR